MSLKYLIGCDRCDNQIALNARDEENAREKAASVGWSREADVDLCDFCTKTAISKVHVRRGYEVRDDAAVRSLVVELYNNMTTGQVGQYLRTHHNISMSHIMIKKILRDAEVPLRPSSVTYDRERQR